MATWLSEDEKGVRVRVRVIPRAKKDRVDGLHGDAVKIRVTAPPVEGAANDALVKFLAKALGVPRRDVSIVQGAHSRNKVISIVGVSKEEVRRALGLNEK